MRSAAAAIAWEFWSVNRRGWLLVLSAIPACALLYRIFGASLQDNDLLQSFGYLPFGISLVAAIAFCNFTDRTRRDEVAGFPRHLFVRPVSTRLFVTCVMACSVLSVVGIYTAWVTLILQPNGLPIVLWWPAIFLGAGVVFYQTIVWCLCSFRLTRVVCLSLVVSALVVVGCAGGKYALTVSAVLSILVVAAHAMTLVTVGAQRRGGAGSFARHKSLVEVIQNAIPKHRWKLATSDAALLWLEWQRSGVLLPMTVALTAALILGPVMRLTGHGPEATMRAATWLAFLPMILAFPIGIGFGKPDMWSFELSFSSFTTVRPVSCGQLIAAKLKSAALSTLAAWAVLIMLAPLGIYLTGDVDHLRGVWGNLCMLYSPVTRWTIMTLCLLLGMALTWSLLVGSLWIGCSGRPKLYYTFASTGVAALLATLICLSLWSDNPREGDIMFANSLPWIPWFLAGVVTVKVWTAAVVTSRLLTRRLITDRHVAQYLVLWLAITALLMFAATLVSPQIVWLRYSFMLAAICAFPAACVAAAPLAVFLNRHQ